MNDSNERPADEAKASIRDRIKTIAELREISAKARAEGKHVVLAHGAFDLLHLGHVRHLEKASALGDVLIVTVTADAFINKGPGRPVFPHELRAEMLAALAFVDWAGVNHEATAEQLLEAVRPTIYVKGSDYMDPKDDPTGKIIAERDIVEKYNGRLEFTNDVTFSSSGLINEHLIARPPQVRSFLAKLRNEGRLNDILNLIDRAENMKAVFVGETILDEYLYVSPLGKTSKDSIIATQYNDRELFAGGVVAAANHAASFCAEVEIVTVLGGGDDYEAFVRSCLAPNVTLTVIKLDGRPTIRKRRYVDSSSRTQGMLRKVFEIAHIDDSPFSKAEYEAIGNAVTAAFKGADAVVVCDFGHGMIEAAVLQAVTDCDTFLAINAQANSANMGFNLITKFSHADYICIDEREAKLAGGRKHADTVDVLQHKLLPAIECQNFFITQGNNGCLCWSQKSGIETVPALEYEPVDTMGAGDAFLAVSTLLLALGGRPEDVGFVGNVVGGTKIRSIGHRASVAKSLIKKSIISLLK
jgi:rfaE bifunctional protein nucleotidyltransferase chain/domain